LHCRLLSQRREDAKREHDRIWWIVGGTVGAAERPDPDPRDAPGVGLRMLRYLRLGIDQVSTIIANFAAHPVVQLSVLVLCIGWLALGGGETALASALTIGGFILTQMVLAQQRRRDNALHLKIDELIVAMRGARNEIAGAETAAEAEIERLRETQGDAG
jgi:low affinity Fe/Cu permease